MATTTDRPLTFLGIAGSLRRASYNRGLIRAAIDLAPVGSRVISFDLADVPMFNADVEAEGDPTPVVDLKRAIAAADALLIATPEYNHCVPGVLKNAIDWASRPPRRSVLTGKPVAIMGASTGRGGTARAQAHLRDGLAYTNGFVLPLPEVLDRLIETTKPSAFRVPQFGHGERAVVIGRGVTLVHEDFSSRFRV